MSLSTMPLDDDIVDRTMTFCPTFSTLQSIILVSKAFHGVFQSHPMLTQWHSIMRAVAYNIVGPALPQALRVVRYPYHEHQEDQSTPEEELDPDTMAEACPEEHGASVITVEEKRKLQENSEVIDALENIYSLTRAAYRIMLYCGIFPAIRHTFDELVDLEEDTVKHIQRQRTVLLSTYPTDELLQLYAVGRFMRETIVAVGNDEDHSTDIIDTLLGTGPSGVTRAWKSRSIDDPEDELHWLFTEWEDENTLNIGYFAVPLANIWDTRKVKPPKDEELATKCILDTVIGAIIGANYTCSQCATPGGLKLLTEANWDRLTVAPVQYPRSRLKYSPTITAPLFPIANHLHNADEMGPWIAGMLALKETSGVWDGWEREMSYCEPCLTKFLEDHVWRWFLHERIKGDGMGTPENCWYGYNCKTMVHKPSHALAKNHLCVPIKGDA
ncbi:hypothetical protein B0H19DRAFT_1257920 [Mycena capillaripes]|nr:hypothetical protein B0H19DRAFT_1257920 [Mycena capillaripes]